MNNIVCHEADFRVQIYRLFGLAVLITIPLILFWKYLFGQHTFVFGGIASDSVVQRYPGLIHLAERISRGEYGEGFSFVIGLGEKEGEIFPNLSNWVCFFGRDNVARLMGVSAFAKMALCGIFAYQWAGLFEISLDRRLLIALGYETNAMLTVRAAWDSYATLSLVAIIWLFGFELLLRHPNRRTILVFIGTNIPLLLDLSLFSITFYGTVFIVYGLWRITEKSNYIDTKTIVTICGLGLITLWFALLFRGQRIFLSERFLRGVALFKDTFGKRNVVDFSVLMDAFLRTIGQTICGIDDDFIGYDNFLEGPALYAGIPMMILWPVACYNSPPKRRRFLIVGFALSFVYLMVPAVAIVASGFAGLKYKLSSFWITLLIMYTVTSSFEEEQTNGIKKHSLLLINGTGVLYLFLLFIAKSKGLVSRERAWWYSILLIMLYILVINICMIWGKNCFFLFVTILAAVECILLSYDPINDLTSYTDIELDDLYFDELYEAVSVVQNIDNSWYRIETNPHSFNFCDSLAQDYYGTSSYRGGTGINESVIKYYRTFRLPMSGIKKVYGLAGNLYTSAQLGVKYIVTNYGFYPQFGLELIDTIDNAKIYRNRLSIPLATVYDKQIDRETFNNLSGWERNDVLLSACIVDNHDESVSLITEADLNKNSKVMQNTIDLSEDTVIHLVPEENVVYVLDVKFKEDFLKNYPDGGKESEVGVSELYVRNQKGEVYSQYYEYLSPIEIFGSGITEISFYSKTADLIDNIDVYKYNSESYYSNVIENVRKLQERGIEVLDYSWNYIKGRVSLTSGGILATSIPYDSNWKILIDSEPCKTQMVNVGFVGTSIESGDHVIEMIYEGRPYFSREGWKIVLIASLFAISIMDFIIGKAKRHK